MRNIKLYLFIILIFSSAVGSAKTTLNQSGVTANITTTGFADIEKLIQDTSDYLGPGVANAFALSNIGGYPIGKSYLGDFPHLFVGGSASVGLTNLEYFDKTKDLPDGRYPAAGINTAVYFGLGLGKGFDMMGRVFTFSSGMYQPPFETDYAKLSKLNLYAVGGKARYNIISQKTILPGLFDFGGVTIGLGCDFLKGYVKIGGSIDYKMDSIEVTIPPAGAQPIDLIFKTEYTAEVTWYVISGNTQIVAYFDFFWIFDFYTGLGVTLNYGKFGLNLKGSGKLTTNNSNYKTFVNSTGELGSLILQSDNEYKSDIYIPVYIVGFDIRLFVIALTVESMVNLRNKSDINVQFGARVQF